MIPAIILAAGGSSRMGHPKALLATERPNEAFALRLARTMWEAGAADVVIVAAAVRDEVEEALGAAGVPARVVLNPTPEDGQLSSLLIGLSVVDRPGVGGVLVTPVDLPLVTASTVAGIIDLHRRTSGLIVRPTCKGRYGHPILFDRRLFGELRHADLTLGARVVVRAHAAESAALEVEDDGAFVDIDTPEDYARVFGRAVRVVS